MDPTSGTLALPNLGSRICIIGPSNSGKSTLAEKLAQKLGVRVVHLDQLAHFPDSHWTRRPDHDFVFEHNILVAQDSWVMDGNYSVCMKQRFERASCIIWLDISLIGFLYRYIIRSLRNEKNRPGRLAGAKSEFSFSLIKYTFFNYPKNRKKYDGLLKTIKTPVLRIRSMEELNSYYVKWGLG